MGTIASILIHHWLWAVLAELSPGPLPSKSPLVIAGAPMGCLKTFGTIPTSHFPCSLSEQPKYSDRSSWSSSLFPRGRLSRHFYRREGEWNAQGCTAGEAEDWPVKGMGLSPWRTTPNFSSSVLPGPPAACRYVHLPGAWPPEWDSLA